MTVESDWDDVLVREIEAASPENIAIWYLGCNGFVLKTAGDTTVFIDPYVGIGDPPRTRRMIPVPFDPADVGEADALFGTHEHTDHVHGPSQAPILAATGADYHTTDSGHDVIREQAWLREWSVTDEQLHEVEEGDVVDVGDLTVHVEAAKDPDAEHPISLVFQRADTTVFHGGDARPGEFASVGNRYDIDLGILAFGTVGMIRDRETGEPTRTRWYNDENQIIEAANELQVDTLLPSHWDMWKGMTADPTALYNHADGFPYPASLEIVEVGDRVDL